MISEMGMERLRSLPHSIRMLGRFNVWKYENRDGNRKTKVPYNPITGLMCTGEGDYTTFETAYKALQSKKYDGMGIGLFNGISGIDVDKCVTQNGSRSIGGYPDRILSELAQDILNTMNCYAEYSPSKTGIHLLFIADNYKPLAFKKKYRINNRELKLEVYPSGVTYRFLTITGDTIIDRDLTDRAEQFQKVIDRYMLLPAQDQEQQEQQSTGSGIGSGLSDTQVIEKASRSRQGSLFQELWEGHWEGKYPSQSEGDFKLMTTLAYYTGNNPVQMDRLFRQSGLGKRDKYVKRTDYRGKLINDAIRATKKTYNPKYRSSRNNPVYKSRNDIALKWDSEIEGD